MKGSRAGKRDLHPVEQSSAAKGRRRRRRGGARDCSSAYQEEDPAESVFGTCNSYHGSVDTPIDGVDTGYHSLKQFHEDRVQCVDTVPAIPRKTKPRAFWKKGSRAGKRDLHPVEQSSAAKGRRRRRRGGARDCSSSDQEEDPAESVFELGSIVIQRFECFVLWFGAVVLWCMSRSAQGLVNLLNSQVVFGVGRCAYLLGFFASLHSKRLESLCSDCTALVLLVLLLLLLPLLGLALHAGLPAKVSDNP
ncbi:hypothetical protein Taro_031342 [Colocasia esculenta]|uniref:Uncharacterized protein n=1 Tax=Colocasia esculenta TaxID=4460 RepID=A0A843W645_COLES|nr:hypothetical protein [Colocasia esculenta]